MKKLLVALSARASYSRVRSVLLSLKQKKTIETHVVLFASAASARYGKLEQFLSEDMININWKIESQSDAAQDSAMIRTTSSSMNSIADYILNFNMNGTLVIADRHETIAATIASSYLRKVTFHLLGGEKSGNIDDKVRYANTFLSDFHFVATKKAKIRLEKCGVSSDSIFETGCPSLDYIPKTESLNLNQLTRNFGGTGMNISKLFQGSYIIVLQHAETTSKIDPRLQIRCTIDAVDNLKIPALWIWPNADFGSDEVIREINKARAEGKLDLVHFERSLDPMFFLSVLKHAKCIVGNSSVAVRECSFMGLPAVNVGGRQKNREYVQNVINTGYSSEEILAALSKQINRSFYPPSSIYGDGKSGERIADLIDTLFI